jgi:hypothetical protein
VARLTLGRRGGARGRAGRPCRIGRCDYGQGSSERLCRVRRRASLADLLIVPSMAFAGILMAPLPLSVILTVFAAAIVFAFILDAVKARIFRALEME